MSDAIVLANWFIVAKEVAMTAVSLLTGRTVTALTADKTCDDLADQLGGYQEVKFKVATEEGGSLTVEVTVRRPSGSRRWLPIDAVVTWPGRSQPHRLSFRFGFDWSDERLYDHISLAEARALRALVWIFNNVPGVAFLERGFFESLDPKGIQVLAPFGNDADGVEVIFHGRSSGVKLASVRFVATNLQPVALTIFAPFGQQYAFRFHRTDGGEEVWSRQS